MIAEKNFVFNDSNIFYRVTGKGSNVVLLHGFAEDGNIWNYQIDFLQKHFRLIVPDIPGSGRSEMLGGASSIEDYSNVLRAIVEREKIESCTIIGHSMGGYISLAYAASYAGELNGLGLFHSTASADDGERRKARLRAIEFLKKHSAMAFLEETIPNEFGSQFRQNHQEEINQLIKAAKYFTKESLIQYYRAMMQRIDRKNVLQSFHKPVLFIVGEEDKILNLQDILAQSHQPWQSHVYILKTAAHMGMWEEKEKSNEILLSFLRHVNEN